MNHTEALEYVKNHSMAQSHAAWDTLAQDLATAMAEAGTKAPFGTTRDVVMAIQRYVDERKMWATTLESTFRMQLPHLLKPLFGDEVVSLIAQVGAIKESDGDELNTNPV